MVGYLLQAVLCRNIAAHDTVPKLFSPYCNTALVVKGLMEH